MGKMLHGFGPTKKGGENLHQFYRDDIGFGSVELGALDKPKFEGMGRDVLRVIFEDTIRPYRRDFASGEGFLKAEDVLGHERGTEAFVGQIINRARQCDPAFKFIGE